MQQENIEQVKDRLHVFSAENPEKIAVVEQIHSDFVQQYLTFFDLSQTQSKPDTQCLQALRGHNILFDQDQLFCPSPIISLTNNSPNYQFLTVSIQFGFFTFHDITIANINLPFPKMLASHEGWGTFGKVFKILFQQVELALKVCQLSKGQSVKADLQDLSQKIQSVLKEYCLSKLASALGVGPMISSQLGFDIIVYKDCVGYPMEYCQHDKYDYAFGSAQADLKQKLLRMHSFQFMHLDIKDDNICFSKKKKQFVFIDFGLSTIIPERIGRKTYTMYLGTANYCSAEMAKLITKQDGGFVDLYHNDICCLQKVLSSEGDSWSSNQQPINLDYLYQEKEVNWNGYDSYQKSIMPFYLKNLAYKLKFHQFYEMLEAYGGKLKNSDVGNVYNYIKGANFTSKYIVTTSKLLNALDQLQTKADRSSFSQFFSEEDQMFYQSIFNIVGGLKTIESKKKNKKLLKSVRDRQVLLNIEDIMKLDYKVYFRLLLEVIQVNVNCSTYDQKLKYCKVAREIFKKVPKKSIIAISELVDYTFRHRQPLLDDLESASLIFFCYSLQGKIDATKIAIFHSIIYNVVLLQILDLQALLSFYRKLQHLSLDFSKKMRMILKFKTTIHWKFFEIRYSFHDRVKLVQQVKDLNQRFEDQQRAFLSQKQSQFMKLVNMECIQRTCHKNLRLIRTGLKELTNGRYSQFLKEWDFLQQLKMWFICNLVRRGTLCQKQVKDMFASEIFLHIQRKEKAVQYFHLEFILSRIRISQGSAIQVIELFESVFKGTKTEKKYCMGLIREVAQYYKSSYSNYRGFLQAAQGFDLSKVNFQSLFGILVKHVFSLIIQDKNINVLPAHLRKIYDQLMILDWIKADFTFKESAADQQILDILANLIMVQFYVCRAHPQHEIQGILGPRIKKLYEYSYAQIRGFTSKRFMNNALLILNAVGVYAIFRKGLFYEAIKLLKYVYVIFDNMTAQEDIQLLTKIDIYSLFLKWAFVKDVMKVMKKEDYITIYENYIKILKELSLYKELLSHQHLIIEIVVFFLRHRQSELPSLINRLSNEVLEATETKQLHNYYISLENLYYCGQFTSILGKANIGVLAKMDEVRKNPYNAIYLYFAMSNPMMRSQRRFLQLCTSFNRIKKNIAKRIRACYYKYFLSFYLHQLTDRKKRRLFFTDFKHDHKQWKLQNVTKIDVQTLEIILSEQQLNSWMDWRVKAKFNMVKMKLKQYFIGVNKRGDAYEDEFKQGPEYFFHMQAKSLKDH